MYKSEYVANAFNDRMRPVHSHSGLVCGVIHRGSSSSSSSRLLLGESFLAHSRQLELELDPVLRNLIQAVGVGPKVHDIQSLMRVVTDVKHEHNRHRHAHREFENLQIRPGR